MIIDTITVDAQKGTESITFNVWAVKANVIPTFRFVPDNGSEKYMDTITATYNYGRWILNSNAWLVDKEEIRKYCKKTLQEKI